MDPLLAKLPLSRIGDDGLTSITKLGAAETLILLVCWGNGRKLLPEAIPD